MTAKQLTDRIFAKPFNPQSTNVIRGITQQLQNFCNMRFIEDVTLNLDEVTSARSII